MHIAMISAPELGDGVDPGADADSQVPTLAATLAERDHQVTIHTSTDGVVHSSVGEGRSGVRVAPLPDEEPGSSQAPARYATALAEHWHDDKPDVVHAFGCCAGLAAVAATGDGTRIPHVQDYRCVSPESVEHDERREHLQATLGRRADRVLAASRNHADQLAARGVPRQRLAVVPYGVDLDVYHPNRAGDTNRTRYRLVCVGGHAEPGVADLIEALRRIQDAEVVITGLHFDQAEVDAAAKLRALAEERGVADRVRLLGDVGDGDRASLYQNADLVVSGPTWTATGQACLQAMACGAPIVATTPDGSDDAVLDGVSGELVPRHQPDQLAQTIVELLADPTRRMAYGIAAADRAATCYGWGRAATAAEDAYASATNTGDAHGTRGPS